MAVSGAVRADRWASIRRGAFTAATFGMLWMVIIGLNPLSEKVKTIPATGDGDLARQLCYSLIFIVALLASRPLTHPRNLFALPLTVTIALGWCWLSLSWSAVPDVGMRRLILTSIIMFSIFRSVKEIGHERTIALIRLVLLITLVLNYVAIVVTPAAVHQMAEIGDPNLIGNWRGVLPQKNFAGAICAFTVILFTFDAQKLQRWLRAVVIVGALFFLYKTHSKTSQGILVLAMIVGWVYTRYNPSYRALIIPLISVIGCAGVLYVEMNWDALMAPLHSPDALTGRTQIWPPLANFANDHLLTGSGFGSFWNIGPTSPIYQYAEGWVSGIASGHNGYLDMLVQVGLPGLTLIVISMIIWPMIRLLGSRTAPRQTGALMLALIVFCMGHNTTESSLFDRDMVVQQFLSFAVAMVGSVLGTSYAARRARTDRIPRAQFIAAQRPLAREGRA
ncbi:O-antigen ligase [Sphingosinicella sp. BN140058]|uniref:O-antigen ligase family protein n=1 Tax=Sphingosinicella sp. BN140058 TaxID=1892855 RepID=UPI0013ECB917|nr:O-antigen ligase family protein [Sphingosinicella sp. BN140058]